MNQYTNINSQLEALKLKDIETYFYEKIGNNASIIPKVTPFKGINTDMLYIKDNKLLFIKFMDTTEDLFFILEEELLEVMNEEYELLKIYQRYVEETKSHPLEYAGDVGVIFVYDNFLGLSPFLYEMLRNGYFQNGDMEGFENMTIGKIIKIYEKKISKDKE